MASYTTIDNPELYFQTKLYLQNASTNAITLDGSENMQPDWVWIKNRDSSNRDHRIFDSVRGANKPLKVNGNTAEATATDTLNSFDSDGFTLGADSEGYGVNDLNTNNTVAWNWKAGTSFSNDASATGVGTIDSTGSISTTAGFSIISYSGASSTGTVAHGIGTPKMIIVKSRSHAKDWTVYHSALGNTKWIELNSNGASQTNSNRWNNTSPTSSVFTVATDSSVNASGYTYIAYCFQEIRGFSKFGLYVGNGSTNGPQVHLGFKPSWIMVKGRDSNRWWSMQDKERSPFNLMGDVLFANTSGAEETNNSNYYIDFLSNGFKIRGSSEFNNNNGDVYTFMAFAEAPFVNSKGVPCNAK